MTGAVIFPIYGLCYTLISSKSGYYSKGREVPLAQAKALLPAIIVGLLIPTIAMYIPWKNIETSMALTAFWQPAPAYINVLMWILPYFYSNSNGEATQTKAAHLPYLKNVYKTSIAIGAIAHFAIVIKSFQDGTLSQVFVPDKSGVATSMAAGLHYIFQVDWIFTYIATLVWMFLVNLDLKIAGKRSMNPIMIVLTMGLLGPGGGPAAFWMWREDVMAEVDKKISAK